MRTVITRGYFRLINYGFIYLFTVSGKGYVGQTPYLKKRFKDHFREKKWSLYFHNSLRKHFKENGSFKILETWKRNNRTLDEFRKLLGNRETFWIKKLDTFDPEQKKGWNLTKGGCGSLGYRPTKETLEKISGRNHHFFGKHPSKETRKLLSEAHKGEKHYFFGRSGKDASFFGKHHSEETLKILSELRQGEKNPSVKLTKKQVQEIRSRNLPQKELAKIYGVSQSHISAIKTKKLWREL